MKIRIIDLLNKIANGEVDTEVKTKYYSSDWEENDFLLSVYNSFGVRNNNEVVKFLNDYVEIIEEPKKIEKILISMDDNSMPFVGNSQYKHLSYSEIDLMMATKINELIDEINSLKEKK